MSLEEANLRGWQTECEICHANMHVVYDYDSPFLRSQVKSALESLPSPLFFKVFDILPLKEETLTQVQKSLARSQALLPGSTQLKRSNRYPKLYLKCEYQNPTGSFKDIGTVCEFSKAYELGLSGTGDNDNFSGLDRDRRTEELAALHLASTGNMGISAIYYAHAMEVPLILHISKNVNQSKIQKMKALGLDSGNSVRSCLECVETTSGYDIIQNHVKELFETASNGSRMWVGDTTLRIEGCKMIGYEIFSQLQRVPDNVIVPVGNGTLLCAIWKAFDELRRLNLSTKIPRIYGLVVPEKLHKKVSALGVMRPSDLTVAFKIIRETNGALFSLDEQLVVEGRERLFSEDGIDAELAGALSYASYESILPDSRRASETTVALITGKSHEQRASGNA